MPLTKTRRAELEAELLKTMDRLDALRVELREAQRENREQVQLHQKKLLELRDILSGREGEQTLIPGTETGAVKPKKAKRPAASTARLQAAQAGVAQWCTRCDEVMPISRDSDLCTRCTSRVTRTGWQRKTRAEARSTNP